jgi:hypothetical protein
MQRLNRYILVVMKTGNNRRFTFLFNYGSGLESSSLLLLPFVGPFYQLWMIVMILEQLEK